MDKLRTGIVGLGWMGWLYDVADRRTAPRGGGMPPLREDRDAPAHTHPGREGLPSAFADGVRLHPRLDLVCGCEPDQARLEAFGQRYGVTALYTDYREMFRREKLDVAVITTLTNIRPEVTRLAIESGVQGIYSEKPMALTLAEADAVVEASARANVPIIMGKISTTHPAFARARQLIDDGAIGKVLSLESNQMNGQHNTWTYLVDSDADWVIGSVEGEGRDDDEVWYGTGLIHLANGVSCVVRPGAPPLRITGESGEILLDNLGGKLRPLYFRLFKDVEAVGIRQRQEIEWPAPNILEGWSTVYGFQELVECMEKGTEPRVSARRARRAMELQIALRESARRGGARIELPLADRSLSMKYPHR